MSSNKEEADVDASPVFHVASLATGTAQALSKSAAADDDDNSNNRVHFANMSIVKEEADVNASSLNDFFVEESPPIETGPSCTDGGSGIEPTFAEKSALIGSVLLMASLAEGELPEGAPEPIYHKTFHVESIRLIGSINLFVLFFLGMIITETIVNKTIPPNTTVVYEMFGFNHACNWVDHNPARMVAAIIVPFAQIPFILYIFLFHVRLYFRFQQGLLPKYILTYSRIVSPYNAFAFAMLHLWFVNTPEEGYGFTAHYIPYAMFQIALGFMAILQVLYLRATKNLPCRIKPWMAMFYVFFLIGITLVSLISVCAILSNNPIIDTKNNAVHQGVLRLISYVYALCVLILPVLWCCLERRDGDVQTIAFG